MVLVMVVHNLDMVTATVPMSMIMLKDILMKRQIPRGFRLRLIIPTSGSQSMSLWDVTDTTQLVQWMTDHLGEGVTHEVNEVAEDFSHGISNLLAQARTADKIQDTTRKAMTATSSQFGKIDNKYSISEKTEKTLEVAKQKSSAVFQKVATSASKAKNAAMENPAMAQAAAAVNQGWQASWKSVEKGFDWAVHKMAKPSSSGRRGGGPQSASSPNEATAPDVGDSGSREVTESSHGGSGEMPDEAGALQKASKGEENGSGVPSGPTNAVFSLDDEFLDADDGPGSK